MAAAAKAMEDEMPATPTAPAAKPRGMMMPLVLAVVISAAASGGVAYFFSHQAAPAAAAAHDAAAKPETEAKAPADYIPLTPAFVVNLRDDEAMRFLQVDVEVMTREAHTADQIKTHMPRIRNSLLMLFGQQRALDLVTREDKERLQAQVLAEIQRILVEETGKPAVEAVYFTSFVMQ